MIIGLSIVLVLVLLLPFAIHRVEQNLEIFLFVMGIAAALISHVLDSHLVARALHDPIGISLAVLIAGLVFRWAQRPLERAITSLRHKIPHKLFVAVLVIVLGLISSIITAIIAAIVLVFVVGTMRLTRSAELKLVVIACFSIGLGASLTPVGEPLATIVVSKLHVGFFYLFSLIGVDVIVAIVLFGCLAAWLVKSTPAAAVVAGGGASVHESYREIIIRAIKIFLFVMGLTFLGAGFEPFIDRFLVHVSYLALYWINIISAILDNATLTAAEVSPEMDAITIKAILLGLLISGGMLVPGNIPNIISASKLKIGSTEWAKVGLPIGFATMVVYFVVILVR